MFDLSAWLPLYRGAVLSLFGSRVRFIGLQGSRARGEESAHSDIDVVLITDTLTPGDLLRYRDALDALPHRELICGFVSERKTLSGWTRAELFQFYYDTVPLFGRLEDIIPVPNADDARLAVQNGACGVYHACCHNLLHARSADVLPQLYKSAVFTLQALHFCRTGQYLRTRAELQKALTGDDARVLETAARLRACAPGDWEACSALLLEWSSGLIAGF